MSNPFSPLSLKLSTSGCVTWNCGVEDGEGEGEKTCSWFNVTGKKICSFILCGRINVLSYFPITAGMCVIPDTRDMALVFPQPQSAVCSQKGPSFPPDPFHQPIRDRSQRSLSKLIGWSKTEALTVTPTYAFLLHTVAACSQALRADIYSQVIYWTTTMGISTSDSRMRERSLQTND